jgi:hypothetical protein
MDVIGFKLDEGCTVQKYLAIVADFNTTWGVNHAYKTRIAAPLQSATLDTLFWVGETENAAAFGAAWDAWRDALADPKTPEAKLQAHFDACGTIVSRDGYDVY